MTATNSPARPCPRAAATPSSLNRVEGRAVAAASQSARAAARRTEDLNAACNRSTRTSSRSASGRLLTAPTQYGNQTHDPLSHPAPSGRRGPALLAACDNPAGSVQRPPSARHLAATSRSQASPQATVRRHQRSTQQGATPLLAEQRGNELSVRAVAGIGCPHPVITYRRRGLGGGGETTVPASSATRVRWRVRKLLVAAAPPSRTDEQLDELELRHHLRARGRTQCRAARLRPTFASTDRQHDCSAGVSGVWARGACSRA